MFIKNDNFFYLRYSSNVKIIFYTFEIFVIYIKDKFFDPSVIPLLLSSPLSTPVKSKTND